VGDGSTSIFCTESLVGENAAPGAIWGEEEMNTEHYTEPHWFKLLKYQQARGRTGLTPSFLIGAFRLSHARQEMSDTEAYGELAGLLVSLRDKVPDAYSVVIKVCNDLNFPKPIAALYAREHEWADCESVADHSGKPSPLWLESQYFAKKKRTIESAAEGLWKRFDTHLISGEFSFRDGKYAPFNEEDLKFIEDAYAYKEPDSSKWKVRLE
jgi:hypothetical protein